MSAAQQVQDGGGDTLPLEAKQDQRGKPPVSTHDGQKSGSAHPYEGSQQPSQETNAGGQKIGCGCHEAENGDPHTQQHKDQSQRLQREAPRKLTPHRRHEDQKHMLQFDYMYEKEAQARKASKEPSSLRPSAPTLAPPTTSYSDEEFESSPLIEDESTKLIRQQRQQAYREELLEQLSQRELQRMRQKEQQARARQQRAAFAVATGAHPQPQPPPPTIENYERQLRMEQMEEMRRQVQAQKDREVQRLRRIYRKDEKKLMAHLQRLKLQDGAGAGDVSRVAPPPPQPPQPIDKVSYVYDSPQSPEIQDPHLRDVSAEAEPSKPRIGTGTSTQDEQPSRKKKDLLVSHSTSTLLSKPLTFKQAFVRLQQQRKAEQRLLEERRATVAAVKADAERRESLERDARNYADWRTSYSLAGVPLKKIAPAQQRRFNIATGWFDKQRAAEQAKRVERDRQLVSWREEKDRQIRERRMKEKAEQKIAMEIQEKRKKEAEKSFQRWILEIRARKTAEMAAGPRGAIEGKNENVNDR